MGDGEEARCEVVGITESSNVIDAVAALDPSVRAGEAAAAAAVAAARRQRPREGHALLLASREGGGHAVVEARQADQVERLGHARAAIGVAAREAVGDVAGDAQVGEERRVLEDHADAAPLGRD